MARLNVTTRRPLVRSSRRRGARWAALQRRWAAIRRSRWFAESVAASWLSALIVAVAVACPVVGARWVPVVLVAIPLLAAGLLVGRRLLRWLCVVAVLALACDVGFIGWRSVRPGELLVVLAAMVWSVRLTRTRQTLGVQGLRGEAMLVDLRDRLATQGEMPALPAGWQSETVLRSAGGSSFGGDFLVAALTDSGTLEVVLVDVSGKGVDAGTRALLLSGAFGGLLGAVAPREFLPAANDYLLRQNWGEGFATAVHVAIDLVTGGYVVESAGHLPAVQFASGSGVWRLIEAGSDQSTALGIVAQAQFSAQHGVLAPGDAMLLYTDGLVEIAGRDVSFGIDKLVGEAERLVTRGFRDGARRLVEVAADASDDQALVMIWRE